LLGWCLHVFKYNLIVRATVFCYYTKLVASSINE
jgi:hypothetical protein